MSSFTPRSWKSQTEFRAERHAEVPVGKFHAYRHGKPNNLPITSAILFGRERDVAEVKELLTHHRLVTLVGSGGVGKTRLAIHIGTELLDLFPDGVWFVDLAPIADPELVASVIAQALGMSQQGARVDEAIPAWLKHKHLLLIFDNCEHVLEPIASIAAATLRIASRVQIVATSRQVLNIDGEAAHRVPSLAVPEATDDLKPDKTLEYGAVALFVARATAADTRFRLTGDTAPIVAEICRRLDGIPLAIELAAARVKVLSIPHLARRLDERFRLLTGGRRDLLPRQKTLHALIDWSYDLLSAQEKLFFARLGIFASGFELDAATNVCGGEGIDEPDVLDLLGSLTDRSLVVAETSGERERYRLLETNAAYALEKLRTLGEHETLARRHAEYYRDEAEAAGERFGTGSRTAWLASVELELDNFRSALAWALTEGNDPVLGGAIAGALGSFWAPAGLRVEGRYWIDRALARVSEAEQPRIASRLQWRLSWLSSGTRKRDAAERAIQLAMAAGDARTASRAQLELAHALSQIGQLDGAQVAIESALAASRAGGDAWTAANALNVLAMIEGQRGDVRAARECFAQSLSAFKAFEDETGAAMVLGNVAELEFADGHPDEALRSLTEALEIQLRARNPTDIAVDYVNGAAYRIALGDLVGARESAREGLRVARQARVELFIAIAMQHLAVLLALGDDGRRGAQLLGYVDARYEELGNKREPTERWGYDKLVTALRETLGEDEIARLATEGAAWSEDRAVEEALKA